MTLDAKTTKAGSKRVRPVSKPTKHTRQGRVSLSSFCWYCVYLIWTLNFWSQQLHFWSVGSLIFYPCQETKWNASQPRNFLGTCLSSFPSFCWYAESDQRSSFDHVVINFDQYGSLIFYPCQETKWNANQPRNFLGTLKYPLLLLSRCVFFIRLVRNWIGLKKQVLLINKYQCIFNCGQQFYYGQIAQFNIFDPFPFSNCTLDFTYVTAANQLPRKEPKIQISPQLGRELRPSLGLVSCIVQFHAAQNKSGL
jgi:hypothetical protein